MEKRTFIILFAAAMATVFAATALTAFAVTTVNFTSGVWNASGNVGIGTTTRL